MLGAPSAIAGSARVVEGLASGTIAPVGTAEAELEELALEEPAAAAAAGADVAPLLDEDEDAADALGGAAGISPGHSRSRCVPWSCRWYYDQCVADHSEEQV